MKLLFDESVTQAAKVLGIARHTLSRVINGQAGISPEMAIRLERAGWSNADQWLRVQAAYDQALRATDYSMTTALRFAGPAAAASLAPFFDVAVDPRFPYAEGDGSTFQP